MSADTPSLPAPLDDEASKYTPAVDPEASRYDPATVDDQRTNYVAEASPSANQTGSWPQAAGGGELPRRFGQYELLEEIARGGMGVVYRARQLGPNGQTLRPVALKMILAGAEASREVIQRFWTEAQTASALNHPNIVRIFEVGENEGRPFFSMELVEGGNLADLVRNGPLPPREAARIVEQLAEGVQAVHEQGVIHRDIKPQNVLLGQAAAPKIADFGLARTREGGCSVTGDQLGTPSYMAPEQAAGKVRETSAATDVYGLGAVLYFLLTGRPPFSSSSPMETMRLVLCEEPVPPRHLNPAVPRDLETVCLKCLEKASGRRYPTARQLAEELGRFGEGRPVLVKPVSKPERFWRWCRHNPTVASLGSLVLLLLLLGTGVGWLLAVRAEAEAERAQLSERREAKRADDEKAAKEEVKRLLGELQEQTKKTEAALRASEAEKAKYQFVAYAARLETAKQALERGQPDEARNVLRLCEPRFCHWEHDYLLRQTERLKLDVSGHADSVTSVAFSPDGKRLVSGSNDRTLKIWDAQTDQESRTLKGHTDVVFSVAFSPNGKRLVSGSWDKTVKVWDAQTGQENLTLKGHTEGVTSVAFSPDGKRIVSGSQDKTMKMWDAQTGQEALSLKGNIGAVGCVAFSPALPR